MPRPPRPLTLRQRKFVESYQGDAQQAALKAGYSPKYAKRGAYRFLRDSRIKKSIEERDNAFLKRLGRRQANAVRITRNDIVNLSADLAKTAESEGARVAALALLAKIFGMIVNKTEDVTEKYAGWTDEEMDEYARTGIYPERIRFLSGESGVPEGISTS